MPDIPKISEQEIIVSDGRMTFALILFIHQLIAVLEDYEARLTALEP